MRRTGWMVAVAFLCSSQPVWAARLGVHDAAESQEYGRKFGGMIGRGVLNVATCFVDVLVNVVKGTKDGPPLVGTLTGVAKGTGCGVLRLGSGTVDLVTFWVPGFNGFPVSDSYEDCLTISESAASSETVFSSGQPTTSWEVPTAEPGAAQPPVPVASAPSAPTKKKWTK